MLSLVRFFAEVKVALQLYSRKKKASRSSASWPFAALKIQNSSTRVRCRTGSLCCNAAFEGQRDDQLLCFLFLHLSSSRLLEGLPLPRLSVLSKTADSQQ